CTQGLPLSSIPDSNTISTPADRNSAVAAWTSSTRKPTTGPVVKCRLISLSGPKTSTLLLSGSLSIQNPGRSSSSRRPRTSWKKATAGSALSGRVPPQASLMIRMARPLPQLGLGKPRPGVHGHGCRAGGQERLSFLRGLGNDDADWVSDGTAVRVDSTDLLVRRPLGLHRPDRGPWGRASCRSGRRGLWGRA